LNERLHNQLLDEVDRGVNKEEDNAEGRNHQNDGLEAQNEELDVEYEFYESENSERENSEIYSEGSATERLLEI
jgi:hypothetical protein